jgi:biopolymer transport protein ExbD
MNLRNSVRRRRMLRKAERPDAVPLNLVSMIDVFTTLVFFLLLTSTNAQVLRSPKSLQLPVSTTQDQPGDTAVLMVTPENILWQGQPLMKTADAEHTPGNVLAPLKSQMLLIPMVPNLSSSEPGALTRGDITIMADKDIPYTLLKKVMTTCGEAKFARISLSVNHKSERSVAR